MILVTGAAQGLGEAIAIELARCGHNLVIHHNQTDPQRVVKICRSFGVQAESIQADLSDPTKFITAYLRLFPETKGLVNNVGHWEEGVPKDCDSVALMKMNLHLPEKLIGALLPIIEKNRGHIVNIGTAGIEKPTLSCTAYAVTKAALWKYTLSLAKAVSNVKVNMVSPGALENTMGNPTGNLVALSEVARLVAFLFSSEAITGQNIEVAAGFLL